MDVLKFGSKGTPFIIIPGMGVKSALNEKKAIEKIYGRIIENHQVYVFEREEVLPYNTTIDTLAEDVYKTIKMLNIDKAIVYGVSQGGMIATTLAIKHQEVIDKLILASTCVRKTSISDDSMNSWIELSYKKDSVGLTKLFIEKVYSQRYGKRLLAILDVNNIKYTDKELERFYILSKANIGFDVYDKLDQIKCPTLVIGAKQDNVLSVEGSYDIINKLHCKNYIYEEGSHAIYDEKASEVVNNIIEFID